MPIKDEINLYLTPFEINAPLEALDWNKLFGPYAKITNATKLMLFFVTIFWVSTLPPNTFLNGRSS